MKRAGKNGVKRVNKILITGFALMLIVLSSITTFCSIGSAKRASNDEPEIEFLMIDSIIDNNYATTEIHEKFKNPFNYSIDETFTFQIPEKAFISNFSLVIGNDTYFAKIVSKEVGEQKFQEAVVNGSDAGLVESKGKNVFSYSVSLSPFSEMIVGLRYEQFLEKALGGYEFIIPITGGTATRNVKDFSIDVFLRSRLSINSVNVQNYIDNTKVNSKSPNEVAVSYRASTTTPQEDFIINYELEAPPINGTMLTYNDGTEEYFFNVFSPQREDLGGKAMDKDIIFVLDKSGSMSGTKIQQLKEAFAEIIDQLPEQDNFNIVMFDTSVAKYKTEIIIASTGNKDDAVTYINSIAAGGSTNLNEAMITALDMIHYSETRVPIIVMLTDGLPTEGVTNPPTIRENIKQKNEAEVGIFSLGFGFDVDFEFLKAMSLENYGIAIRIYENEDASEQITNFYETISTPLLKGVKFSYSKGAYEVYPKSVEQLFEGSEIVVVGKYKGNENTISSSVSANSWEGMKDFKETFYFEPGSNNSFIPRFWAYAKIRHLLDEIAVYGENESLKENVTDLALTYEFVTPYTSLLVEITEPEPESTEKPEDKTDTDNDGLTDEWELAHGTDPYDRYDPNSAVPISAPDENDEPNSGKKKSGDSGSYDPILDDNDKAFEALEGAGLGMSLCFLIFIIIPIVLAIVGIAAYTKIKRSKLLEQKRREQIFKYVNENPGEHFRAIQRALDLEIGTVSHHINKLESEEFIKSRQDGQYRRFYPMDSKIDVKLILSQLQQNILNWIKNNPGISQKTIAIQMGMEHKLINYHLKILKNAGFIYTEEQDKDNVYFSAAGA